MRVVVPQHITYFQFGTVLFMHLSLLVLPLLISTYICTFFATILIQIDLAFRLTLILCLSCLSQPFPTYSYFFRSNK